jgi:hypothetical protein
VNGFLRENPRGEATGSLRGNREDEYLPDPQRRPHLLEVSIAAHEILLRDQRIQLSAFRAMIRIANPAAKARAPNALFSGTSRYTMK